MNTFPLTTVRGTPCSFEPSCLMRYENSSRFLAFSGRPISKKLNRISGYRELMLSRNASSFWQYWQR